jgi:hypothetical protein
MLYGYALENSIKGVLIKRHGVFEQAKQNHTKAWNHKILALAEATNLPLTTDQKLLLKTLEAFVIWAGKYPVSLKPEEFTIEKQFQSGDYLTPNEFHRSHLALLEPFYRQLQHEIFADLMTSFGLPPKH